MEEGKKLSELLVAELKAELDTRELDKSGVKAVLVGRLHQFLVDAGEDPETFLFLKSVSDSETTVVSNGNVATEPDEKKPAEPDVKAEPTEDMELNAFVVGDDTPAIEVDIGDQEETDAANTVAVTVNAEVEPEIAVPEEVAEEEEGFELEFEEEEHVEPESKSRDGGAKTVAVEDAAPADVAVVTIVDDEDEFSSFEPTKSASKTADDASGVEPSEPKKDKPEEEVRPKNLWISNLPASTKATDINELFSKYGQVVVAKIVMSGRSKNVCYGFVTMSSPEQAYACCKHLNDTKYNDKTINVEKVPWGEKLMSNPAGLEKILSELEKERNQKRGSSHSSKARVSREKDSKDKDAQKSTSGSTKASSTAGAADDTIEQKYERSKKDVVYYKEQADRYKRKYSKLDSDTQHDISKLKDEMRRNRRNLEDLARVKRELEAKLRDEEDKRQSERQQFNRQRDEFERQGAKLVLREKEVRDREAVIEKLEERKRHTREEPPWAAPPAKRSAYDESEQMGARGTYRGSEALRRGNSPERRPRETSDRYGSSAYGGGYGSAAIASQQGSQPAYPPAQQAYAQPQAARNDSYGSYSAQPAHRQDQTASYGQPQQAAAGATNQWMRPTATQSGGYSHQSATQQSSNVGVGSTFATLMQRSQQPAQPSASYQPAVQMRRY